MFVVTAPGINARCSVRKHSASSTELSSWFCRWTISCSPLGLDSKMTALTCYRCNATLTDDNSSLEHILPNALGGRLKSRALLCKPCNSKCGDTIDAAVINQLMP